MHAPVPRLENTLATESDMRIRRHRPMLAPRTSATTLACSIAAILAMPHAAHSQESAPQAESENRIEEIVVTAQRREEKLQDVGIAVTALGSQMLTDLNITTATDITKAVPSLKMNAYSSSQVV